MINCGVIGIGQTKYSAKRDDVSIAGLVREAALEALQDAGMTWDDIDAIVIGKAPDTFEGVMMPEIYLADALGARHKPMLRVHTAGSVGGSTSCVAASHIESGRFKRILTVAFQKQSESNAMWALSPAIPFQPPMLSGAGGYFSPIVRSYIRKSNAPKHIGHLVAVKDRQHALKNPKAHLHMPDITVEMVANSPMLWDPTTYLETCPSSDGACAMVLAAEDVCDAYDGPVAWVLGHSVRSEPVMFAGRDIVDPAASRACAEEVYKKAGITNPLEQIDVAEVYVPFSWFEPIWIESLGFSGPGDGWKLVEDGTTALGGKCPWNASGGVLSTNPIGASGMIRFAEAAMQVRGTAGEHQVDGAKTALGHAYGGGNQFFAMWIVGADKPS